HGDSERPECCFRSDDFANDAAALLDVLGIERAIIVGHSLGSFAAQAFAIDHPERTAGLVLIGSGARARTEAIEELLWTISEIADPIPTDFLHEFQASTAHTPLDARFFEDLVR